MAAKTQPRAYMPLTSRRYGSFAGKTQTAVATEGAVGAFQAAPWAQRPWQHPPHQASAWGFSLLPPPTRSRPCPA